MATTCLPSQSIIYYALSRKILEMLLKFTAANCNSSSSSLPAHFDIIYYIFLSLLQPLTSQLNFSHSHFISAVTSYQSLFIFLLFGSMLHEVFLSSFFVCVFLDTWQVLWVFEEVLLIFDGKFLCFS